MPADARRCPEFTAWADPGRTDRLGRGHAGSSISEGRTGTREHDFLTNTQVCTIRGYRGFRPHRTGGNQDLPGTHSAVGIR